ncbi:N,N-dimethylformamidase beta subunit family domain-containing protein [Calothrix sp. UHCC 0171]|uniref:N,N-dimethylformamidase beta subunit family domain-containing protein n=1 Tax=Calothrix sp. UHCC 0171 TaxID=3110245 RepID=UPI002B20349D|nr:N,N-dimethylformamidase beta subunit family domain-containing protein [Calothrix sp. UHCC 0171]MEA5573574.1 N,N-dimethylformamidase beta subunit family domain-containing protein [Calothrix sp. UHCC 0171]
MSLQDTYSSTNNLTRSPNHGIYSSYLEPFNTFNHPLVLYGSSSSSNNPQTIAFVDSGVSDAMTLMADIQADVKILLDPTQDGISQISDILKDYNNNLTGIHIISHGNVAQLQLGNSFLSSNSFNQYTEEIQQWNNSLAPGADILLYGCNIANGKEGQVFVNNLSTLTGADVAASTDITGNSLLGGDWILEYSSGSIETTTPFTDSLMNSYAGSLATLFTPSDTPSNTNATDGFGSAGDYELGMEFQTARTGQISAIRYYKAASETGTHIGRIWSSTGQLLASVTFTNETASGWQQQALATPLTIAANTKYVVSVNANSHYVATTNGLAATLTNGDISAVADGSNGVFNETPSAFPTQSWNNSNYFRDIVFTPLQPVNNNPGTIELSGTATQNEILSASVSDVDGLNGVTINYQWQQSSNGTTWTNVSGANNSTLTLGQEQVGNQVRVNATYIDALGSSESLSSTPTGAIVNVNDVGVVAIAGTTVAGQTLTANITDIDGLTGVTPTYQWQQSSDGTTWTNVSGGTTSNLTLDSSYIGKQLRVNAIYIDALGANENILSNPTNAITAVSTTQSLFTTQIPIVTNATDGFGSAGDYELGMEFQSAKAGTINAIRYYKAASETGTHVGKIWSNTGELLASVTFTNETASGWQQQALTTPVAIDANTTYVVSVNANTHYVSTPNGLATTLTNGDVSAVADGSNGVFNFTPNLFPTQSYNNTNYFRDIVFAAVVSNPNNIPGTVDVSGVSTENQTLTANITDVDGFTGANIKYQWQQSNNNGTTWKNISGATNQTFTPDDPQVGQILRVIATYTDNLGSNETVTSAATNIVTNVNDEGLAILAGSATIGASLKANIFDADGLTGSTINYQWQQLVNSIWTDISGATASSLSLTTALLEQQVRVLANYIDAFGTNEDIVSSEVSIAAQNAIVLENQKTGTTNWQISNQANNNEIAGFAGATSINKGESIPIKVSLATPGQYRIDIYRLGYYGGAGARFITSSGLLNGVTQAGPTIDPTTRLVEYNWNTSYTLQTGTDWTTGLYTAKLTDIGTGKESQVWFTVRDDNRPADLGFQEAVTTTEAYNNYGGYSTYTVNSAGGQRAYKVSFDRPFGLTNNEEAFNNRMTWEYSMVRWLESQGYDVSYYTNLDVHTNPLQLYSQKTFLSVGHDEYWSMEMFDNIEQARDNGINLGFFSANTAYWRVRFEPSSTGQENRVMTVYKGDWALDPVAQNDPSAATTVFRSPQLNRPENSLLGVMYTGNTGVAAAFSGFSYVVSNASDPYYAHTGLQNGSTLFGLVGYEWDAVVNNGFTPSGLVILSQSPVAPVGEAPLLPVGTDTSIANAVRYTASSGAKVFSTGTIQWPWGLDSFGPYSRVDSRVQQITVNVLADMGAKPQTPATGIIVS